MNEFMPSLPGGKAQGQMHPFAGRQHGLPDEHISGSSECGLHVCRLNASNLREEEAGRAIAASARSQVKTSDLFNQPHNQQNGWMGVGNETYQLFIHSFFMFSFFVFFHYPPVSVPSPFSFFFSFSLRGGKL